ncbi:MAG: hypothetical protein HY810_07095 [Candidatus Omnitrophica bacterium]|nr:hypothetical protein [Candidatus Omnitrophota bacterium]
MWDKLITNFFIKLFTFLIYLLCIFSTDVFAVEEGCFKLCPWKVGQFVEYQIISFENVGKEHRYLISIIGKENIDDRDYFWIRLDIYEQERQISFEALVEPFNEVYFSEEPEIYISKGIMFLFKNAHRFFIELPDNSRYGIHLRDISNPPDILNGTFYKEVPDEKNRVDYSKLNFTQEKDKVSVPAGKFDCYRFWVDTKEDDDYTDEGFIMWRSPDVPFLGVVKMEFSITEFSKKLNYRYRRQIAHGNWFVRLYAWFLVRTVPEQERKDNCAVKLLSYGYKENISREDLF